MKASTLPLGFFFLSQALAIALPRVASQDDDDSLPSDYLTTYASDDIIPTTETVEVKTSTVATGVSLILPTLSDVEPQTTGFLNSELGTSSPPPLMTSSIPSPASLLKPLKSTTKDKREAEPTSGSLEGRAAADIFASPIGTAAPPSFIKQRSDHPVARQGITKSGPTGTNKFYSNFFLGDQTGPTYTFPYSIAWSKGAGAAASWGLAISHVEASQRGYGDVTYNNAVAYYLNPTGIQSMILSAKELGTSTNLTVDTITAFSAKVSLRKDASSAPIITFPIIQGMAYVTGYFSGGTPMIQTGVYFKSMTKVATAPKTNVVKYNFLLEDGTTWRVYAYKSKGDALNLKLVNNGLAQSTKAFYGWVQIVKDPKTTGSEAILDDGCGIYPTGVQLSGSTSGSTGSYTFTFSKAGHSTGNLYVHALPHHVSSFDATTKALVQSLKMQTTTKGISTLVKGTTWTMKETGLPTGMGFAPWDPSKGSRKTLSTAAKNAINPIALSEVSQDMSAQSNLDSMYYSGKALHKFGQILYIINDLLGNSALAQAGLVNLKAAFEVFSKNTQKYPLVYESAWGGVVSSASYTTGDANVDFGNTYYNDHHFHYGYHILAAAYIAYFDKTWAAANKDYVNTLVRDIANPSSSDPYFPQFRSFDWYHGHSWAKGLYASADGKDQESSSEDVMAAHAIKMWGTMIGDADMVARANLQLAVMARSLGNNYYYLSSNTIQPSNFIGNKAAGILFENKIDHTTYFSSLIQAIQGIHMIPVHAPTLYTRSRTFVQQEWDAYFSNGRVDDFDDAWKGVIYANYATIQPQKAWNFFNSTSFDTTWIDGGASRTWYMAYAAGLGGL